jgi:enhancing lycopene biosynthesis protein 2
MADLLAKTLSGKCLEWGRGSLVEASALRQQYIGALRSADTGDYRALLVFLGVGR